MQTRGDSEAQTAPDDVVPKVCNGFSKAKIAGEYHELSDDRSKKDGGPLDVFEKERRQKNAQDHPIENRSEDVRGLNEILREIREQRKADRHEPPKHGKQP